MKKAKATLPKSAHHSKTKSSESKQKAKSTSIAGRVKKLAKGLVKAMSGKPIKKPQTKSAPKPVPAKPMGAAAKLHSTVKAKANPPANKKIEATKKGAAPALKPSANVAPKSSPVAKTSPAPKMGSAPPATNLAKGKAAPAVAAVLTKGKGKEVKAKGNKMTGAQLAEHLEKMCRETACENLATTKGYCRLDYIKNWKKIKRKEMILKEGKLNQYIEELVSKYPEKYIDVIRQDLNTEVNFNKVIHDLELDESIDDLDYDGDSIDALIGGIKKEGEDFGDEDF